ncbi:MAG: ATP-dependent helicase HrpB [Planctomycetota bacterium]|nr:MAG: ATP-dependent helicase HrpB [Planctomycetota bacterium]
MSEASFPPSLAPLPIDAHLAQVTQALGDHGAAIVVAAPGAGKSTRVAPSLLPHGDGDILLLQPRRVAARAVAARIAAERGEAVGQSIGHHIRHDKVGSAATRLWVITEGILTRRLHHDPYLQGVRVVVVDEFHERSLHADIAFAWVAELRRTVRPDLGLVVMSATIDPQPLSQALDDCPVIDCPGRSFPVATVYQAPAPRTRRDAAVCAGIERALQSVEKGDVLAFVPGVGEIRGVIAGLGHMECVALPLHGSLSAQEQDRALRPDPQGRRKVVVATNVAETSLTIEGVTAVVDSGWQRTAHVDADSGLEILRLERISRWNADQRAGRAGRTAPGWCLRLWSRLEDQRLAAEIVAEIRRSDLAPLCVQLRGIHGNDLRTFPWFEAPDQQRLQAAEELLQQLGYIQAPYGGLTAMGQYLAGLPLHPRLARLLLAAEQADVLPLGAAVAALLSERSIRATMSDRLGHAQRADIEDDLALLAAGPQHPSVHALAWRQIDAARRDLLRHWGAATAAAPAYTPEMAAQLPALLLAAYPDRVGKRSGPRSNNLKIVGGIAAGLAPASCQAVRPGSSGDPLCLAYSIRGLGGHGRHATICEGAAACDWDLLQQVHPTLTWQGEELHWNAQRQRVEAVQVRRYASLTLSWEPSRATNRVAASALLQEQLAGQWQALLQEDAGLGAWLTRWRWLSAQDPSQGLPDPDDPEHGTRLLSLWAHGITAREDLPPVSDYLSLLLDHPQQALLDRLAPAQIQPPRGKPLALDYSDPQRPPSLAIRIQHCFGWRDGPRILGGRMSVRLHLLAPNGREQQITEDLAGFWHGSYQQVRKDLRGRYPKHPWPEDPTTA